MNNKESVTSGSTLLSSLPSDAPLEIAFPSAAEFFLNMPLYEAVAVSKGQEGPARDLKYYTGTLDSYCPDCGEHSIFRQSNIPKNYWADSWNDSPVFHCVFDCSRNHSHQLRFIVSAADGVLMKIGQYPSLATLAIYDVKKYSKVLDKGYYQELTKAIGLAAHGVGVGSFVYLRRIFESLIEKAHQTCASDSGWDDTGYSQARMDEKIQMLKSRLPAFLVENKGMYGVLSKGIHELSEQECLTYFEGVKLGIELILDDEIELRAKADKIANAKKALHGVIAQINK